MRLDELPVELSRFDRNLARVNETDNHFCWRVPKRARK